MIASKFARGAVLLVGLGIALAACSAPNHAGDQVSPHGADAIVHASIGAGLPWVQFADGHTAVSTDAGVTWRALHAPQAPAPGASIAMAGRTLTVAALSATALTVQRSSDGGASWTNETHELSQAADSANVVASADGRQVAVAATLPGSSGSTDGHATLLVGPANGRLTERDTPGTAEVAWSGQQLLMPGGPLRSRLYLSSDEGQSWAAQPVAGPVAPEHDVAPDQPVFGTPVSLGGAAVVPVTSYAGAQATAVLYRTVDGVRFEQLGELALGDGDIGPGVSLAASPYGADAVVVADPFSTELHVFAGGRQTSVAGKGLPGPVDSLSFQSATDGLAQVTVAGCAHGKTDCTEELRVYRTSDGGASWQRTTP
ncbi:MAG TPA: hypothetical protein VGL21_07655 [Jatrophihabitantaceae bacterium]